MLIRFHLVPVAPALLMLVVAGCGFDGRPLGERGDGTPNDMPVLNPADPPSIPGGVSGAMPGGVSGAIPGGDDGTRPTGVVREFPGGVPGAPAGNILPNLPGQPPAGRIDVTGSPLVPGFLGVPPNLVPTLLDAFVNGLALDIFPSGRGPNRLVDLPFLERLCREGEDPDFICRERYGEGR